jgi:DNA-binding transcriptional ArsR family regulator
MTVSSPSGDDLLRILAALASPHRMRVVAALAGGRNYVSRLARELGISRALLQVHLRKLEAVGLVSSELELSEDGKALKFYEVVPFDLNLTPRLIEEAARTLTGLDAHEVTSGRESSHG